MLPKKPVVLIALAVLALLCPVAYADGGEANGNSDDQAVVPAPGEKQKPDSSIELFPTAGREAGSKSLWARAGTTRPASGLASSAGGPAVAPAGSTDDKWEIMFAPYLYLPGIDGDIGVGRATSVPINVKAGDILEQFQFGFMGRFEVRKGPWGGIFEASYVELGASVPMAGAIIGTERVTDAEFEVTMLEGFLSYRPYQSDKTSVDLFGGARYWDMDLDLAVTGPLLSESLSRGERWADPVFGVRVIHFVSDRWFIPVRGDLGGLGGAGKTSDFTWNIQGGIGFQPNKHVALVMQYKALSVDFDNDQQGTPNFFAFDAIQHGPLLGFVFKF